MFKVTHKEELGKTLGFQFERTADGGIFMHQESYVRDVLKRFGMSECRAVSTSADHHAHLCKTGAYRVEKGTPFQGGHQTQSVCDTTDDITTEKSTPARANASYREAIGSLLWLSMDTRPDITFAVSQCARYSSDAKPEHWTAAMRVLRYLKCSPYLGLHYHTHNSSYVDDTLDSPRVRMSNFANSVDDRCSITGYVCLLAGAPLSWNMMTQHTTALSTMESEYYAVCKTTQEAL